jgi:membrane-bound lytic murein transglycosylase D
LTKWPLNWSNRSMKCTWIFLVLIFSLTVHAREVVPDDDGPEQQEEVMPVMPEVIPLPPPAVAVVPPAAAPPAPKWTPSDYANQTRALGWSPDVFKVPPAMEERVEFWKDIYTKYTSDQGILHDSKYITIVYEGVDFSDITANTSLTDKQKEKARRKRVDEKKKEVAKRLKHLQEVKDGSTLTGDDRRYWELLAQVDEPKKFSEAAGRRRLRFQLGQRNQFAAGIYNSGRYIRQMEEIFRQEGLPIELTRLPFVESSFNPRARSKVGATGLWQFMRTSARSYMRIDTSADERNDPLRASRAAAKKLRDNYSMLRSWPLAITAYNRGASGVRRLVEKLGTNDITEIIDVRKGRFGFAGANFYANFLAALDVEHNADKYFGVLDVLPELRGAEIQMSKNQSSKEFLKWFNNDMDMAQLLNPHISEPVWKGRAPLQRKQILRVPLLQENDARGALE